MTCVEALLRSWAKSSEPVLQRAFVEYAFGKVPDKLDTVGLENKTTLILHYGHERPEEDRPRAHSPPLPSPAQVLPRRLNGAEAPDAIDN